MRIAIFSWESMHSICVGGVGVHVTELACGLERKGNEVHVFTRAGNSDQAWYECIHGVHYHRCHFNQSPDFVEEINNILKEAASSQRWSGILKVIDEQVVSSDIIGEPYGAIVDLKFTKVVDGDLVKVLSWYDNEWGYCSTLVKHVLKVAENL